MKWTWILSLSTALLTTALPGAAQNPDFPTRPITLVVPQAAGGGTDVVARAVAHEAGHVLGQAIVVDNRPGAGGNIGTARTARARPDGYTLLMNQISHVINPSLYDNAGYDPLKDFIPVALLANGNMLLAVEAGHPAQNLDDFLRMAKDAAEPLRYSSAGTGTINHLAVAMLERETGLKFENIPYGGGPAALTALIGKQVDFSILAPASSMGMIESGKVRGLAMTAGRSPILPDLPAISETVPSYNVVPWYAIFAPAGTPPAIVEQLHRAINQALEQPALKDKLAQQAIQAAPISQAEFSRIVNDDYHLWSQLLKEMQTKVE